MSPRTGRPLVENPKAERITVRLTEFQQQLIEDCAEQFGTTKADIVCRGIRLMEIEKNNAYARQLLDALVILDELVQKDSSLIDKQINQAKANFNWYLDSIKK